MFTDVSPATYLRARAKNKRQGFFSEVSLADLTALLVNGGRIRLRQNCKAGYLLTSTGDLQGVFNNGEKGLGNLAIQDAIKEGACSLDCFDGFLVDYYKQFGFEVIKREPFNDQFAPAGFKVEQYGRPDIVYMVLSNKEGQYETS